MGLVALILAIVLGNMNMSPAVQATNQWVSPTGHSDPSGDWDEETRAYDDNTGNAAECKGPEDDWGGFLELTVSSLSSSKVRYWIDDEDTDPQVTQIDLDVYVDSSWVDVYSGGFTTDEWIEKTFTAGTVTKARVRFYYTDKKYAALGEFDFWENGAPTAPTSLYCEGESSPVGVADTTPEFSAIGNDPDSGDTLTHAYVQVGTTAGGSDMWDSGWQDITDFTEGNRCADISYAGSTLDDDTKYYWRIKFKDDDGTEGSWSSNAEFTTTGAESTDFVEVLQQSVLPSVYNPRIVGNGSGKMYAVWGDCGTLYLGQTDGKKILTDQILTLESSNVNCDFAVDAHGDSVVVVWHDASDDKYYYRLSTDAGASWTSKAQVSNASCASDYAATVDVAVEGDDVLVIALEGSAGDWDVCVYYTNDGDAASPSWSNKLTYQNMGSWYQQNRVSLAYDPDNNGAWVAYKRRWWRGTYDSNQNTMGSISEGALSQSCCDAADDPGQYLALERVGNDILLAYQSNCVAYYRKQASSASSLGTEREVTGWRVRRGISGIASNGSIVCIVWTSPGKAYTEYYIAKSTDMDGTTWTTERWPDPTPKNWFDCYYPDIAYDSTLSWVGIGTINIGPGCYTDKDVGIATFQEWDEEVEIVQVAAAADDAYQQDHNGGMDYTDETTITVGKSGNDPYFDGWRFEDVTIPYTGVVVGAHLYLYTPDTGVSNDVTIELFTEDDDTPMAFNSGDKLSTRLEDKYPGSGEYCYDDADAVNDYCGLWVEWTISEADENQWIKSPNLAIIIQEQVGRADWDEDDEIVILARPKPGETDSRTVRTYEYGSHDYAAVLEIEWVENDPFRYENMIGFGADGGFSQSDWQDIGATHYDSSIAWGTLAPLITDTIDSYNYGSTDSSVNSAVGYNDWKTTEDGVSVIHYHMALFYNTPGWTSRNDMFEAHLDELDELITALAKRYDGDDDFNNDGDTSDCFATSTSYDEPLCATSPTTFTNNSAKAPLIPYWGHTNEPEWNGDGWQDDDTESPVIDDELEYVRGVATMFLALKRVNSKFNMLYGRLGYDRGGSSANTDKSQDFLYDTLRYGALSFADTVDFHFYPSAPDACSTWTAWDSITEKLDEQDCSSNLEGLRDVLEGNVSVSGYEPYSGSRAKRYIVSETGKNSKSAAKQDVQTEIAFRDVGQAATEPLDYISWFNFKDSGCPCYGLIADQSGSGCEPDGGNVKRPAYYAVWAVNHNLSDTDAVTKMETGAGKDLPTGYEGYLFSTGTITRAVVWQNSGTTDIKITTSGDANDYVRIARSTVITEAEVSGVGTDYDGIGWAKCYDGDKCYYEDGSGSGIWTTTWHDEGSDSNKYQLDNSVTDEPFMIWSDTDDIEITW